MAIRDRNRAGHYFTKGQIEILDAMAAKEGFSDFRTYYNVKLHAIVERSNSEMLMGCNNCNSKKKSYEIPDHLLDQLTQIAQDNCMDIGKLAAKLIISPLLSNHFKDSGF